MENLTTTTYPLWHIGFSVLEWLPPDWTSGNQDLVQLFRELQSLQASKPYLLSADGIADLTDGDEFTLYLNALFEPREIDSYGNPVWDFIWTRILRVKLADILRPFSDSQRDDQGYIYTQDGSWGWCCTSPWTGPGWIVSCCVCTRICQTKEKRYIWLGAIE
jgi:hypothetical protein